MVTIFLLKFSGDFIPFIFLNSRSKVG